MSSSNHWTRKDELQLINNTQDSYVAELIARINAPSDANKVIKTINFTSPTGSGKTKMIAKLINRMPDCYFVITSLSKGQLARQVENSLQQDIVGKNYIVYGSQSFTRVSILTETDILNDITNHHNSRIIWIRDEGHINTNRWMDTLEKECEWIVNFSATNRGDAGIVCNFTHTLMLRTVIQQEGNIEDAIKQLIEVKKEHSNVNGYNPCAIFRLTSSLLEQDVIKKCEKHRLKHISLIDNNDYIMEELCCDDNEFDVIINKQKLVEGIDIRRAHVIWIENEPANSATTIQLIGRCRRNALLWREDIDILSPDNATLLKNTRICYAFYNVKRMKIDTDSNGELAVAFCPYISVQEIKPGSIVRVKNGQMQNGLQITELEGCSGNYEILTDNQTGFNFVHSPYYNDLVGYDNIPIETKRFLMDLPEINRWFARRTESYWIHFNSSLNQISQNDGQKSPMYYRIKNNGELSCFNSVTISPMDTNLISSNISSVYTNIGDIQLTQNELEQLAIHRRLDVFHLSSLRFFNCKNANLSLYNCFASAILSGDTFAQIKQGKDKIWIQSTSVTTKISRHSKLDSFLESFYASDLQSCKDSLYSGKNPYSFGNKRINSCLGYCVEYYAKYLLLGESYLDPFIRIARDEGKKEIDNALILVRACILKYKAMMSSVFGEGVKSVLPSITIDGLSKNPDYVSAVVFLANKTAAFLKTRLNVSEIVNHSHVLSVKGISGLIDVTDGDTIIDVKTTGHIDLSMVKQVLAYHFLSSFRLDMNIKTVIVYDAITNRYVEIKPRIVAPESQFKVNCYDELKKIEHFIKGRAFDACEHNHYLNALTDDSHPSSSRDIMLRELYINYSRFLKRNKALFCEQQYFSLKEEELLKDKNLLFKAALFAIEELHYSLADFLRSVKQEEIRLFLLSRSYDNATCTIRPGFIMIGDCIIYDHNLDIVKLLHSLWKYRGGIEDNGAITRIRYSTVNVIEINGEILPVRLSFFSLSFANNYVSAQFMCRNNFIDYNTIQLSLQSEKWVTVKVINNLLVLRFSM